MLANENKSALYKLYKTYKSIVITRLQTVILSSEFLYIIAPQEHDCCSKEEIYQNIPCLTWFNFQ